MRRKILFNESLPAIDWQMCLALANHKPAVAQEILSLVVQQLPGDLKAIKEARAKKDHAEFLRLVHKLHGALCYSGMPRLKNAVAQLETALKANFDEIKLAALSRNLEFEVDAVLASKIPV